MVGQDLAQLFDPTEKLQTGLSGIGIARKDQLRNVADSPHRSIGFLRMDCIAKAQDVGVGRYHRKAGSFVTILDHGTVDQDPFMRAKLQYQPDPRAGHA
jgi:hypothetical protein